MNRNQLKAYRIVDYFQKNPKNNPLIPVVASLFNFFSNILLIQTAADKSEAGLMEQTNIRSAYRVRKLKEASMQFSKVACVNIISYIRECDVKSKGQGSRQDPYDLFKELVYKIMHSWALFYAIEIAQCNHNWERIWSGKRVGFLSGKHIVESVVHSSF